MLDKYKDQYEKSDYGPNNPYFKPFMTGALPSVKLWNECHLMICEKSFYESIHVYHGDLRRDHEERMQELNRKAAKQENKEFWIIFTIVVLLILGVLIFLFDIIAGFIVFCLCAVPFTAEALKNGAKV